eukprot:2563725-Amphidinium_carterae.1
MEGQFLVVAINSESQRHKKRQPVPFKTKENKKFTSFVFSSLSHHDAPSDIYRKAANGKDDPLANA